jgi:hypothetical protein
MSSAQEYRRKAEEAEKMAETASERSIKRAYLTIAKQWRVMAAHAERAASESRVLRVRARTPQDWLEPMGRLLLPPT